MFASLQTCVAVAFGAAALGRFSGPTPVVTPTTCICRCDGERLGGESEVALNLAPPVFELPGISVGGGVIAGVLLTLVALRCWHSVLHSLRQAIYVDPVAVRRPRALAP